MAMRDTWRRVRRRITEAFYALSNTPTSYTGRVVGNVKRWSSGWSTPTHDWSKPDYSYWREAAWARVDGLDLSGLLIRPVVEKVAAWTLGRAPEWMLENEKSMEALAEWWGEQHDTILKGWLDALGEGDSYVLIHVDATLAILPPESMEIIVDETDFTRIIGYRSTQNIPHPSDKKTMQIVDEWREDGFSRETKIDGVVVEMQEWPNPVPGLIPVVHIANRPLSNQTFGHPECEALVPLFHKYGEVLDAAIEGNVLQGRPTPTLTFETVQDLESFDDDNATTETQVLPDGRSQTVKTYDIDLSQLLVASGAQFDYKAPGSFVGDTERILGLLFYLLLEHTQLPEFIFGNAISSSKASAETQMPVFVEFIKMRRSEMATWLNEIAIVAAVYLSLVSPDLDTSEPPQIQWDDLTSEDGTLTLETLKWAFLEGLIDQRTALMLAPVEFEDIDAILLAAEGEREEALEREQDAFDREVELAAAGAGDTSGADDDDD